MRSRFLGAALIVVVLLCFTSEADAVLGKLSTFLSPSAQRHRYRIRTHAQATRITPWSTQSVFIHTTSRKPLQMYSNLASNLADSQYSALFYMYCLTLSHTLHTDEQGAVLRSTKPAEAAELLQCGAGFSDKTSPSEKDYTVKLAGETARIHVETRCACLPSRAASAVLALQLAAYTYPLDPALGMC